MEIRSRKVGVQGVMLPSVLMISLVMVLMGCVVRHDPSQKNPVPYSKRYG